MRPIRVAEDIVPLGEFKAQASRIIGELRAGRRPVVITQNGRPAAALLDPEEYDRLAERERFLAAVNQGLADVEAGRVIDHEDLAKEMDALFGPASES